MIEMNSDFNFTVASRFLGNVHVKSISTHSAPPPPFWAEQITEVYVCFVFCSIKYTESRLPCFTAERGPYFTTEGPLNIYSSVSAGNISVNTLGYCDCVKFIYSEKATKFCEIFTLCTYIGQK